MNNTTKCAEPNTPCQYRSNDQCLFWVKAEKDPAALEPIPGMDGLLVIDTYREPCLEEYEKGHFGVNHSSSPANLVG